MIWCNMIMMCIDMIVMCFVKFQSTYLYIYPHPLLSYPIPYTLDTPTPYRPYSLPPLLPTALPPGLLCPIALLPYRPTH
jgi:hypothetical protein